MKTIPLYDTLPFQIDNVSKRMKRLFFSDSGSFNDDFSLVCDIVATHSGMLINSRVYPQDKVKKSVKSWLAPYKKPVLENHDYNGDVLGRVFGAKYTAYKPGDDVPEQSGFKADGFVQLTPRIVDPVAIKKILDGRYTTVSVGMNTDHFYCSICNEDWSEGEGPCEHQIGKYYDKQLAYGITGVLNYKDLSFVSVPADEFGTVVGKRVIGNSELNDFKTSLHLYANKSDESLLIDMATETEINSKPEEGDEDSLIIIINSSKENKNKEGKDQVGKTVFEKVSKEDLLGLDAVKEIVADAIEKDKDGCAELVKKAVEDCQKKAKDSIDILNTKLDECKELRQSQDSSVKILTKTNANLESEIKDLKGKLGSKEEENKTVLDSNIQLTTKLHKQLAERCVDLKISLGKPDVADVKTSEQREERVNDLAERTPESLEDSITDLISEKLSRPIGDSGERVENPAMVRDEEKTKKIDKDSETKEDVKKRLFGRRK